MEKTKLCGFGLCALGAATLLACFDSGSGPEPRAPLRDLRITEIHYHPADRDTVSGDEYEFLELKNAGTKDIDLSGVGFTDGIDFRFPKGTTLKAGAFFVLAADAERFQERYGFAPHGAYAGGLNNAGERLTCRDIDAGAEILSATYSDQAPWPAAADGGGYSLVLRSASDDVTAAAWRASYRLHGAPGADDGGVVLVNEVLTHTDPPALDAIELFNHGDTGADVGGWYLSDDPSFPAKFRIPEGTVIPAMGHLVFDEEDFNRDTASPSSFSLSSHGDEVWLFSDSAGCARGWCHGFDFGEIENGLTFGRLVTSAGHEHHPIQKQPSLGAENTGPRTGPVVISEVMYHPANDTDEYLEIVNTAREPVELFDKQRPANTWKVGGLAFAFPQGITLAPGEAVVIATMAAPMARIRAAYGLDSTVRLFQAAGKLGNAGDSLALLRPESPYLKPGAAPGDSTVPYVVIDRVSYGDGGPWPNSPDGDGPALARKALDAYGDDPANWDADAASPGKAP